LPQALFASFKHPCFQLWTHASPIFRITHQTELFAS
jgi:hypothetical protein